MSSPPPTSSRSAVSGWVVCIILVTCLGALFLPRVAPPPGRYWGVAWDFLHVPGFFLITWALHACLSFFSISMGLRLSLAASGAILIAFLSEAAHDALGRSSNLLDLVRDGVGIVLAVLFLAFWSRSDRWGKWWLGAIGLVTAAGVLVSTWWALGS